MLRTCVILALAVLLLAACGRTSDEQLSTTADAPEVHALAGPSLHSWQPEPPTTTTVPPPPPTTSTTHPPSPQVQAASATGPVVASSGHVNGYPCGGALPTCRVLACESGGNPTAENPSSTASGLWQILDGTWAGFGGYSHAAHAPWQVQNEKAAQLWAGGAGRSHWAACL